MVPPSLVVLLLLLKQKKTPENPLKNELANPSGLDFANQMGALVAQPTQINMVPPGDETRQVVQPEKIASGVKSETKKVLEPRSNIYDINMQGRKSFTFACQGTFHHLRLYGAIVHFSVKLVTTPVASAGSGAGYQQYHVPAHDDEAAADSLYGPVIVPNRFADFFFKKATIELEGGIEIEPTNQTHQITKLIRFHMNTTPENAEAKYSTLGGYVKDYDSTLSTQKYQVPVAPDADGVMQPIAGGGNDYKTIQRDEFLEGTAGQPNAGFRYTTKGAAALSNKFNNGAEVHFQVPLHRICRITCCEQMLPSNKDYYITLHRMKESFLLTCQDAAVHQNLIFQITNCEIHIPIVELMPEKRQEERDKITSPEGIAYKILNDYVRSFYIYPIDRIKHEHNVTGGYKLGVIIIYWLDFSHETDGDIQMNNYLLERPNLRSLEVWLNEILIQEWKPRPNQTAIDWDTIYAHYVSWCGRTITTKDIWMNGKTIIPVKIKPNPDEQIKDDNYYTLTETCSVRIKQVFNGQPNRRELRM